MGGISVNDMEKCWKCGFYDGDYGCTCPPTDTWYACPIESEKPENIQALNEYIESVRKERKNNNVKN